MEFIASTSEFESDVAAKILWQQLKESLEAVDGICYYRHPVIGSSRHGAMPDITLLAEGYTPLAVRIISAPLTEITDTSERVWRIQETEIDSPVAQIDDFVIAFAAKLDKERALRRKLSPIGVLALPNISEKDFKRKFPAAGEQISATECLVAWQGSTVKDLLKEIPKLPPREWALAKAVLESTSPLNRIASNVPETATTLGAAIRILENGIALLDREQHKATVQIAPGPQRMAPSRFAWKIKKRNLWLGKSKEPVRAGHQEVTLVCMIAKQPSPFVRPPSPSRLPQTI